jgi:hypothetical protein
LIRAVRPTDTGMSGGARLAHPVDRAHRGRAAGRFGASMPVPPFSCGGPFFRNIPAALIHQRRVRVRPPKSVTRIRPDLGRGVPDPAHPPSNRRGGAAPRRHSSRPHRHRRGRITPLPVLRHFFPHGSIGSGSAKSLVGRGVGGNVRPNWAARGIALTDSLPVAERGNFSRSGPRGLAATSQPR